MARCLTQRLLGFGLLVAVLPCPALDPRLTIPQFNLRVWQGSQGLANSSVTALLDGPDGKLWVGTTSGLYRFDGSSFEEVPTSGKRPLVLCLLKDAQGSVWFGTYSDGLGQWAAGKTHFWSTLDGLVSNQVAAVFEDSHGSIWVGSDRGGLGRLNPSTRKWTFETVLAGLPGHLVTSIASDGKDGLWIGTTDGVAHRSNGHLLAFPISAPNRSPAVYAVLPDRKGNVWLATLGGGLFKLDKDHFAPVQELGLASAKTCVKLLEDRDQNLWVATQDAGLLRRTSFGWEQWTKAEGLPNEIILSLLEDRNGNLWAGTGNGLLRLREDRFATFTKREGLPSDAVWTVSEDASGELWVGTNNGAAHAVGNRFTPVGKGHPAFAAGVRSLLATTKGPVWGGTSGAGLVDLQSSLPLPEELQVPDKFLGPMTEDRRSQFWFGSFRNGLFRRSGRLWTNYRLENGLPSNTVTALLSLQDDLWVGTNAGLTRLAPDGWKKIAGPQVSVTYLYPIQGPAILATTFGQGLWRIQGDKAARIDPKGLYFDPILHAIGQDVSGDFWLYSRDGIVRFPQAALPALQNGDAAFSRETFGLSHGIPVGVTLAPGSPSMARTRDGRLWFASQAGLIVSDPSRHRPRPAPDVLISSMKIDGTVVPLGPEIRIPAGSRRFEIEYVGLDLSSPERLRYQVKLEGVDHQWMNVGIERRSNFTTLRPGSYRFLVRALQDEGTGPIAALTLTQEPHFYQAWWFYLLCAFALFGSLSFAHRRRLAVAEESFRAVLSERSRLARELHDTLLQDFLGLLWKLESLRRHLPQDNPEAFEELDQLGKKLDRALRDTRVALSELRRDDVESSPLEVTLRQCTQKFLVGSGIHWSLESTGPTRPMPQRVQHNATMIAQEALVNALRHAEATELCIRITFDDSNVEISIADNGKGFLLEPGHKSPPGHYGLAGMAERARLIHGRVLLETRPGAGTIVRLIIQDRAGLRKFSINGIMRGIRSFRLLRS